MTVIFNGSGKYNVESIVPYGSGSLGDRFLITIDGTRYFAKTFRSGENFFGRASREMIKNEISVLEFIARSESETSDDTGSGIKQEKLSEKLGYRGYIEIADVTTLLFEDMVSWRQGGTIADKIGVRKEYVSMPGDVPTSQEILNLKRGIIADNYARYNVSEVVDIISQVASQLDKYHKLKFGKQTGIVHMDITPHNVMLVEDAEETIRTKAIVMDFGIARGMDKPLIELFNKGRVENTDAKAMVYYASRGAIFNRIYSPIVSSEEKTATASFDAYNTVSLMCLMLTGRLPDYFGTKSDVMRENIKSVIATRCDTLDMGSEQKSFVVNELCRMITSGPEIESINGRYESCEDLLQELERLQLVHNYERIPYLRPRLTIPYKIEQFVLPQPEALRSFYMPEWLRLNSIAQNFEPTAPSITDKPFAALERNIERTITDYLDVQDHKINLRDGSPLIQGLKRAGVGIGIGTLSAAGLAALYWLSQNA